MISRLTDNVQNAKDILCKTTPINRIYDVYDCGNFVEFTTDDGVYRVYTDGKVTCRW